MAADFRLAGLGGFSFGLVVAFLMPNSFFKRYIYKWGIPFEPQTIYYKGSPEAPVPVDLDAVVKPIEGRIMKKLKSLDMAEDEEMQQARDRHDDNLLRIEKAELDWLEQQTKDETPDMQGRFNEYEAAKRVMTKREAQGKQ